MKMGYVAVKTLPGCSLFPPGVAVRGHIYHFSEILEVGRSCISLHMAVSPASREMPHMGVRAATQHCKQEPGCDRAQ